jgi:hypothetical protein
MNSQFLQGLGLMVLGQILVWFQTNAQFLWPKAKEHTLAISMTGGVLISYMFIIGVGKIAAAYQGEVWPSRIIPSAIGTVVFAIMTWLLLNQGMSSKTITCLILSFTIIFIQIFWK